MATIKLNSNGKVITKNDKVSCECCNPPYMIIFYNDATIPKVYINFDECPNVGRPCGFSRIPSCSGLTISGFIYSDEWNFIPSGKTPKAMIYAEATFDNWGNIGSAVSDNQGTNNCVLGKTILNVIDTPTLEGKKMKLPFSATNSIHGGPYGIYSAVVKWYWE